MSDQHPDRPDDAPADAPSVDLPGVDLPSGDLTGADRSDADQTGTDLTSVDAPGPDEPVVVPTAAAEDVVPPADDDPSDLAPAGATPDDLRPLPPDDEDAAEPTGTNRDALTSEDHVLTREDDVLASDQVDDVADAALDVPAAEPHAAVTGDLDGPDGGLPQDVVHVDDDALVRPLDAPLAHVLGKDADDLSVLTAPAEPSDPDLPVGAPDHDLPADAPVADPSDPSWEQHAPAGENAPDHVDEGLPAAAWDEHALTDADAARYFDGGVGDTTRDEDARADAPVAGHGDERSPDAALADEPGAAGIDEAMAAPVVPAASAAAPVPPAVVRTTPDAAAPGSGWAVLGRALRPRVTRAQVLAGVLCALLGFALAVQIRQTSDLSLSGMRQADLVRILDEATTRGDALERERADLVDERDELLSGSDTRQAALDALRRSAETQGILAGRLPAEGRGVVVTVSDGGSQVKPVTMLNMLEELRNAGAEAMQLNDQRITASSAFTGTAGAIQLDGTTLSAPYVWKVIGDPDTIATALQMPGGAFAEVRNNGANASVEPQDLVEVSAVRVLPDPVHATPVPPTTD
ncbi:DUF881 domain-containing protein [Cellulomonas fimi]|uniref:DUF881 domain-containing protein n=1 Tax=Cellulomonas fimi TaxID=1708 RepID=UPI00234D8420|nr:DUF881 domain-containing protein [Cellulomonas fimi]MDC7120510.1 DUF881 domain-containing protein [Cellulomonas fimi]